MVVWPVVQTSESKLQRRKPPKLLTLVLGIVAVIAMMRTFRSCSHDLEQRQLSLNSPASRQTA